jgi:SPP1 gp7 family putative phage head morphogenesis protein
MVQTNKQQSSRQEVKATASEPLVDAFLQHQVRIQGLTADEVRKFGPFLKRIDADVRKRLSGDALTTYSRSRLTRLLTALDGTLADVFDEYKTTLAKDLQGFATHEAGFTAGTMEAHIEGVNFDLPTASQIRAAVKSRPLSVRGTDGGKLLDELVTDWTTKERSAVTNAIRRGVVEGQTNSDIVRAIRGTRALKYNDGILATTDRHARAVVHTAVQHVSSVARQETFSANSDIVKGVRWIATLDRHTCQTCRSLDQTVYGIDAGPRPPIHINDRCTVAPVLDDEFADLMKGALRPAVVGSTASQVSASLDYYTWLKRQPESFIYEVLGPRRAKLFIDGGLSAKRFAALQLDRQFKALTLAEMKALEPAAFAKAGL